MSIETIGTDFMQYLRSKTIAVISTVSPTGQPMAATIYFVIDDKFNFYFTTKSFTRKHENLEHNPNVALVIGADNEPVTAQIQGKAERITEQGEIDLRMSQIEEIFGKNEYVAPLFQLAPPRNEVLVYKITPNWMRWLDLRGDKTDGDFIQIMPQQHG